MPKQKSNFRIREVKDLKKNTSTFIIEEYIQPSFLVRLTALVFPLYVRFKWSIIYDETNTLKEASELLEIYKKGRFQEIIH